MGFAQVDTTGRTIDTTGKQNNEVDTIKVGGMIIIRKHDGNEITHEKKEKSETHHHYYRSSNLSTNWWIIDFGFSNYADQTDYSSSEAQDFAPGSTKESLKVKT
ncbi:MAG TPA: hypothetical protein VH815_01100, partial [Acidobacteriota bacterium]